VEVPFISPFDGPIWLCMRRYIAELGAHDSVVAAAIFAAEALYKAEAENQDTASAMALYYAAKSEYTKMLETERRDLHTTLIVTCILCCFEIVAQQETISITLKSEGAFVNKLEKWANHGT
jgi:hypothetical protein